MPSVPLISTTPVRAKACWNEKVDSADTPAANSMSAEWCVGTSTGNSWPARGPEPMVRVDRAVEEVACTRRAGPRACTRVVT